MTDTPRALRLWAGFALALLLGLLATFQLERARSGLEIREFTVGETPVTLYRQPGTNGPVVIIAHGFAGSRQIMQAWSLTLAKAGYTAFAFDLEGHGKNPVPMSGDLTAIEGTTERLVQQTLAVAEAAREKTGTGAPVALLGHSMATDIIVRAAAIIENPGPVVAISMFSEAVTDQAPRDLIMITGEWEGSLRAFARDALQMIESGAAEGDTVLSGDLRRRAVIAPNVEHVGVLYSRTGLREARDWLDSYYQRESRTKIVTIGGWLLLLLASIVAIAKPLSTILPEKRGENEILPTRQFAILIVAPALLAPMLAVWVKIQAFPILVADYLLVHLLIYGGVQIALARHFGIPIGRFSVVGAITLVAFGLGVLGLALDRYGTNFTPIEARLPLIAGLAVGAVPFMVADAMTTQAGRETPLRRLLARVAFLASLGVAVLLDFERLFFLIMIAPIILLFFLLFGLMGRWAGQRAGTLTAGISLGLILAWALGVSFPMFVATG